jgi:uncharacterized protein
MSGPNWPNCDAHAQSSQEFTVTDPLAPAERIAHILNHFCTIAVVGLSPKPHRASFDVARYMQSAGYRIIPVNPNATEVLGEKSYASLTQAAQHETIDLVNCFRNSEDIAPVVDEAIAIGAKAVWMQLGITHAAAAAKAEAAGLLVVQDHCLKIDHRVLMSSGLLPEAPAQADAPSR